MIVTLPAETVGIFCKGCKGCIGFSMYPAVEVEVDDGVAVGIPRALRLVVHGCQGEPSLPHPWITRFMRRVDGGGEEQIA